MSADSKDPRGACAERDTVRRHTRVTGTYDPYYDADAFDPYKAKRAEKKSARREVRESAEERQARLEVEHEAEMMAAASPLVAALLGIEVGK